jgi:hypothetical protein
MNRAVTILNALWAAVGISACILWLVIGAIALGELTK